MATPPPPIDRGTLISEMVQLFNDLNKFMIKKVEEKLEELKKEMGRYVFEGREELKAEVEKLTKEHEDLRQQLIGLLMRFCSQSSSSSTSSSRKNTIHHIMNVEIDVCVSLESQTDDEVEALMKVVSSFKTQAETMSESVRQLEVRFLDETKNARDSKKGKEVASGGTASRKGKGVKFAEPEILKKVSIADIKGIMMAMYGFSKEEAEGIKISIKDMKAANRASLKIKYEDAVLYLSRAAGFKQKFLTQARDEKKLSKIDLTVKNWVFNLENSFSCLVFDLYSLTSGIKAAFKRFHTLYFSLKEMKQENDGWVPILVYRILDLLQLSCETQAEPSGAAVASTSEKNLCEELGFFKAIESIQEEIPNLKFVLKCAVDCEADKEVRDSCVQNLQKTENKVRQIREKVNKVKSKPKT